MRTRYTCVRCGYTSGRIGKFIHMYFGWSWWRFRNPNSIRCRKLKA